MKHKQGDRQYFICLTVKKIKTISYRIYMSLFIQSENQNLLWEMIHKISILHSIFPEGSPIQEKNLWFKNHIEKKYLQLPQSISRNDLSKINREILAEMVDNLKKRAEPSMSQQQQPQQQQQQQQQPHDQSIRGTFSRLQNPTKKPDYETTALQYNSLFEVPKPKVIDFTEKLDDEIITNMDELIENHRKMREQDLQEFMPAVDPGSNSNKISILENIQIKHVSFDLPEENIIKAPEPQPQGQSNQTILYDNYFIKLNEKCENMDKKINTIMELLEKFIDKDIPL